MPTARTWREYPKRYRYEAAICNKCGKWFFPARLICDKCGHREFETKNMGRFGTILTHTIIRIAPAPFVDQAPYAMAVVEMDDGPRIANLMLEGIWDENVRTEETAALLGALASGRAIALQPVFSESERFAGVSSELRLANDADIPLRIHARFDEHSQASACFIQGV